MQILFEALNEAKTFLEQHHLKYFVIGGIANSIWGQPRATLDADIKLVLGDFGLKTLIELLTPQFKFRVSDPLKFAQQTWVIPIYASNQIPVDLIIGLLPYEQEAAESAQMVNSQGVTFRVCTAEDLIIQKAISERAKDWEDITGILARQGEKLNQDYILACLQQFSEILNNSIFLDRYKKLLQAKNSTKKKKK